MGIFNSGADLIEDSANVVGIFSGAFGTFDNVIYQAPSGARVIAKIADMRLGVDLNLNQPATLRLYVKKFNQPALNAPPNELSLAFTNGGLIGQSEGESLFYPANTDQEKSLLFYDEIFMREGDQLKISLNVAGLPPTINTSVRLSLKVYKLFN